MLSDEGQDPVSSWLVEDGHALRPPLVGRRVRLRPIGPADYEFLYRLADAGMNPRLRPPGATPDPDQLMRSYWNGVLAQFVIVSKAKDVPVGLVVSYDADLRNRRASVAIFVLPQYHGAGWPVEAFFLMLHYLFSTYRFHKLTADVAEYNYSRFASGKDKLFTEEGRFRDHEFVHGRHYDVIRLAFFPDAFYGRFGRLLPKEAVVPTTRACSPRVAP